MGRYAEVGRSIADVKQKTADYPDAFDGWLREEFGYTHDDAELLIRLAEQGRPQSEADELALLDLVERRRGWA